MKLVFWRHSTKKVGSKILEIFQHQVGGQNPGENFQGDFRDLFRETFQREKEFLVFRQNESFDF